MAAGHGQESRLDQLSRPTDVIFDKETDSILVCDTGNRQIMRWPRQNDGMNGEIVLDNVDGVRLMIDDQNNLYITNFEKHEVRRYSLGDKNGIVVVGGDNAKGDRLGQLNYPVCIFVDREYSVYVADSRNHCVMKWTKEGKVVAGGQGDRNRLTRLTDRRGLWIDESNTIYVVDSSNSRVMRWREYENQGTIFVGGNDQGENSNKFIDPIGIFFDRHDNLYIVDTGNNRIQLFLNSNELTFFCYIIFE